MLPNLAPVSKSTLSPLITPGVPIPLTSPAPSSVYSTSPSSGAMHAQRNSLDFHPNAAPSGPSSSANKPANLDHLSALLFRGEKKQAVQFATEEKMWSHALIISSCIDKQTWGEVVTAFSRAELPPAAADGSTKGRDALRLTYEMFGGAGTSKFARDIAACISSTGCDLTDPVFPAFLHSDHQPSSALCRSQSAVLCSCLCRTSSIGSPSVNRDARQLARSCRDARLEPKLRGH